ncbi:MAG: hypothetical protein IJG31_02415 [Fusobacterium sp.]|nr:hypothetical protein [Fusobacterium sp.]
MKKIHILLFFLINSVFSFANLTDNLNLLKEEDKKIVEERMKQLAEEKNLTVFVNTLPSDEGFKISDPEHAMILNLKKIENTKKYEVELSFSKDIDIEDYRDEIEEALNSTEEILKQEEYGKYLGATLDEISGVLKNIEIEPLNQMTMTQQQEEKGSSVLILSAIVLVIVMSFAYVSYKLDTLNKRKK